MIICLSANPAIDRRLRLEQLTVGEVNRVRRAQPAPGGKAAHVAMAAQALGAEVLWIGLLGGATGEECEGGLTALGIPVAAVKTKSATRVNLEIIDDAGTVTELLEPGGVAQAEEIEALVNLCETRFEQWRGQAQVVISGSLPPRVPVDLYARLIRLAHAYDCRVLLDTSGEALLCALAAAPDLVKPNRTETEALLGRPLRRDATRFEAVRWLLAQGARSAAISLGAEGIVWQPAGAEKPLRGRPPVITGRSPVGSGDATLAGFAVAQARGLSVQETLRLALACGAANCLAEAPGRIKLAEVERLKPLVILAES